MKEFNVKILAMLKALVVFTVKQHTLVITILTETKDTSSKNQEKFTWRNRNFETKHDTF